MLRGSRQRCDNHPIPLPQSSWRKENDYLHPKDQHLASRICLHGSRIPDPDPQMSIDQVRDLLTPPYPEIATATLTGPEDTGKNLRYSFSRAIGSKG
jgi:PRTRC genetic system protein C